jgi:enamine deaminase RidA (YjgF/YER057c/UK114 family)
MVFVSGMIGWDAEGVFQTDDFAGAGAPGAAEHRRGAGEAGRPEHIVRMTWYVLDKRSTWPPIRRSARPIASSSAPLSGHDGGAGGGPDRGPGRVEIEVTAVVPVNIIAMC